MPELLDPALLWFIAGVVLILLEFVGPGVVIGFFGVGAILTAVTTWLGLTPGIGSQCLVFSISSAALLLGVRRFVKPWFQGSSELDGEDPDDDFTGREALALTDFQDGDGQVEIKGANWKARAKAPIAKGDVVIIERLEDLTLHVRPRE